MNAQTVDWSLCICKFLSTVALLMHQTVDIVRTVDRQLIEDNMRTLPVDRTVTSGTLIFSSALDRLGLIFACVGMKRTACAGNHFSSSTLAYVQMVFVILK